MLGLLGVALSKRRAEKRKKKRLLVSSDTTHPSGSIPPINLAQIALGVRTLTVIEWVSRRHVIYHDRVRLQEMRPLKRLERRLDELRNFVKCF